MKVLALWLAVMALLLGVILYFLPIGEDEDWERSATRRERADWDGFGPIDRASLLGADVVTWIDATTVIDGKPCVWPKLLLFAGSLAPEDERTFELERVLVLFNEEPRTAADLARIIRVDPGLAPHLIGAFFEEQRSRVPWLSAPNARLIGGKNLQQAKQIQLSRGPQRAGVQNRGAVEGRLPASMSPMGEVTLSVPEMVIDFEDQQIVRIKGEGPVIIEGTLGSFKGRDLTVDPLTKTFTLHRNITGTFSNPELLSARIPPLSFEAGGPLTFASRAGQGQRSGAGTLTVEGGVFLRRSDALGRLEAKSLIASLSGPSTTLEELSLEENVIVSTAFGDISGSQLTLLPDPTKGDVLTLSGGPVSGTLVDGARFLPNLGASGDMTWTTPGQVVMRGAGSTGSVATLRVGPAVELRAARTGVVINGGGSLVVGVHRVADRRAGALAGALRWELREVDLDGGVTAKGPLGDLRTVSLSYRREADQDSLPGDDVVTLIGDPAVDYVLQRVMEEGSPEIKARVRVAAADRIIVRRDPLANRPIAVTAGNHAELRWREPLGTEWIDVTTVRAARIEMALREAWIPILGSSLSFTEFEGHRDLARVDAVGRVLVQTRAGHELDAERFLFDREADAVRIEGRKGERKATLKLVSTRGENSETHTLVAPIIRYDIALREVVARNGATLESPLQEARWDGGFAMSDVDAPTTVTAGDLTMGLDVADARGLFPRAMSLQRIVARDGVTVEQPLSKATCDRLDADIAHRSWFARGTPAILTFLAEGRSEAEREEMRARGITISRSDVLADGDVSGRLLLPPLISGKGAPSSASTKTLLMTRIETPGAVIMNATSIDLAKGGTIVQGDPANRGFELSGRRLTLLLDGGSGGASSSLSGALATGDVRFHAGILLARSESLTFNRADAVVVLETPGGKAHLDIKGVSPFPADYWEVDLSDPSNPRPRSRSARKTPHD